MRGGDPYLPGFGEERGVLRTVVKSKIHRVAVTGAGLGHLSRRR